MQKVMTTTTGILARKRLCQRLYTGIKAVDVFHPLAHGLCIAILGLKGSGKTTLALDILANQRFEEGKRTHCVYVSIGQEVSAVKKIVDALSARKSAVTGEGKER